MTLSPSLVRSFLLTSFLSFLTPIVLMGMILTALFSLSLIPGISMLTESAVNQILEFLAVFGRGCELEGILIIGFTSAIVGGLFDLFNFYRYQNFKS